MILKIRQFCEAKKMTMGQLSEKVGTTQQTLRAYETGEEPQITVGLLNRIADVLETTPSELIDWQ